MHEHVHKHTYLFTYAHAQRQWLPLFLGELHLCFWEYHFSVRTSTSQSVFKYWIWNTNKPQQQIWILVQSSPWPDHKRYCLWAFLGSVIDQNCVNINSWSLWTKTVTQLWRTKLFSHKKYKWVFDALQQCFLLNACMKYSNPDKVICGLCRYIATLDHTGHLNSALCWQSLLLTYVSRLELWADTSLMHTQMARILCCVHAAKV